MKLKTKYAARMRGELEGMLGCPVAVVEDREAKYPCKMEYARNYGRDRHVVRVNPARCASEYPVFMMLPATKFQLRKTADGGWGGYAPRRRGDGACRRSGVRPARMPELPRSASGRCG